MYCLCVMCTVLLPPDVNPVAVNKYIIININNAAQLKHLWDTNYIFFYHNHLYNLKIKKRDIRGSHSGVVKDSGIPGIEAVCLEACPLTFRLISLPLLQTN